MYYQYLMADSYPHGTVRCSHCKNILLKERCYCTGRETRGEKYCTIHQQFYKRTTFNSIHARCQPVERNVIALKTVTEMQNFTQQNPTATLKFVMETLHTRAEMPLFVSLDGRAFVDLKENTLQKKLKKQVMPILDSWFHKPVISTYIVKQKDTQQALKPYIERHERAAVEKYRHELRIENDNNAVLVNKGLGASMSAFDRQRHLLAYETNAQKQVRIDDNPQPYNIKKKTKEKFVNNSLLIDILFQFVNDEPSISKINWTTIRNKMNSYMQSHIIESSSTKELWQDITNQSSIGTTLKYAYIITCIKRYSTVTIVERLSQLYKQSDFKLNCWKAPKITDLLQEIPHREYILEWIYFHSQEKYPTSDVPRARKRLRLTPSDQKMPTSTPIASIRSLIYSSLVGVYCSDTEFELKSDGEFYHLFANNPTKIFIGKPYSFTGVHKHNSVHIVGRICDLRTDIISFLAVLNSSGILLPQSTSVSINLIIWIDNMPCMITSLMKSAW